MNTPSNFTYDFEHIADRRNEASERLSKLNLTNVFLESGKSFSELLKFPEGTPEVMDKVKEILMAYDYSEAEAEDAMDDPITAIRIAINFVTEDYFLSKFFSKDGRLAYSSIFSGNEAEFNPEDYQFSLDAKLEDYYQKTPFVSEMEMKEDKNSIPEYTIDHEGKVTKQYPMMLVPKEIEPGTIGYDALAIQGRVNINEKGELILVDVDFRFMGMPSDGDPVSIFLRKPE